MSRTHKIFHNFKLTVLYNWFQPSGRTTPQSRSRTTSRESSHVLSTSSRPKPDGSETPSASKFSKTPDAKVSKAVEKKPRSASVTPRHPRTSGVGSATKDAKSDASLKPSPRQQATKKLTYDFSSLISPKNSRFKTKAKNAGSSSKTRNDQKADKSQASC